MNLGSRFRITLKNLKICIIYFVGFKKIEEKKSRGRERESDEREKTIKNQIESYRNCAYMHGYCCTFTFMHNFTPIDMGVFWVKIYKMICFLYFGKIL